MTTEGGDQKTLVLIVDDDRVIRMLIRESLEEYDFELIEAQDGVEAVEMFHKQHPDIILMDVLMPRMDGFLTCSTIRQLPGGENTPILIVTGSYDLDSIHRAYEVGATDFVTKPLNREVLGHRLKYMLRGARATNALRKSELKNQAILDAIPDTIFTLDQQGTILEFKGARGCALEEAGVSPIGRNITQVFPKDVALQARRFLKLTLESGEKHLFDFQMIQGDRIRYNEVQFSYFSSNEVMVLVRDITGRKRTEEALRKSEELFQRSFDAAGIGMALVQLDTTCFRVNPAFCRMLGFSPEELLDVKMKSLLLADEQEDFYNVVQRLIGGEVVSDDVVFERRFIRKDGETVWVALTVTLVRDGNGTPLHFVYETEDITDRKRSHEEIRQLAYYDALTGLPNRILLQDRVRLALSQAQRDGLLLGMLFLDVDHFKQVNDTLGHASGDKLLKMISQRLKTCLRECDTLARLGGDEFVILLPKVKNAHGVAAVARKILNTVSIPYDLTVREVQVSASIGIALFPHDGLNIETLLKHSDMAMYAAKGQGRNAYQFFSERMNQQADEFGDLQTSLANAINNNEICLDYQPIIDIPTQTLAGVEALLRWCHPQNGIIPPGWIIPAAEETGLIRKVEEWVLRNACRQAADWLGKGLKVPRIAINLTDHHLKQPHFADTVLGILEEAGLAPDRLELELSENALMQDADALSSTLKKLKKHGVMFGVDVFGSGYSPLHYLNHFPLDRIKIAPAFIRDMDHNPDEVAHIESTIAQAHRSGFLVTVKGVENEQQMNFLQNNSCREGQGFFFGRPIPSAELVNLLRQDGLWLRNEIREEKVASNCKRSVRQLTVIQ